MKPCSVCGFLECRCGASPAVTDRTVPAEKIEALAASFDAPHFSALTGPYVAACLRALLPRPPLVIEPRRWYWTRDGRKVFMGECGYATVYPLGGPRGEPELVNYPRRDGRVYEVTDTGLDIIALWEDAPDA